MAATVSTLDPLLHLIRGGGSKGTIDALAQAAQSYMPGDFFSLSMLSKIDLAALTHSKGTNISCRYSFSGFAHNFLEWYASCDKQDRTCHY